MPGQLTTLPTIRERVERWLFGPQPIARLAMIRIAAPLAIVGFMSSRVIHADDWLSDAGFHVPSTIVDWRQPLPMPAPPVWLAWTLAIALVVAGLATSLGAFTRWAAGLFAALCAYVALADRLEAFTVSKLAPVIAFALCVTPSGAAYSIDAWRKKQPVPTLVSGGCVRFFQIMLPVFYFSSGVCKASNDWLSNGFVLWTHLHDSYQTWISWALANILPTFAWTVIQLMVLTFEAGAPLWFSLKWTRPYAVVFGVTMHLMIGLMFGPVIWFSLLMIILLVSSYAPERWLVRVLSLRKRA